MLRGLGRWIAVPMVIASVLAFPATGAAGTAKARCKQALRTAGFDANDWNLVLGTAGDDTFTAADLTADRDAICGLHGDDSIDRLEGGDLFLGGSGADHAGLLLDAEFLGGSDDDTVDQIGNFEDAPAGYFDGGMGDDSVGFQRNGTFFGNEGADHLGTLTFDGGPCGGTCAIFLGGDGNDTVDSMTSVRAAVGGALFDGGAGTDTVTSFDGGSFDGGTEADVVGHMVNGFFVGGDGDDRVHLMAGGVAEFQGGAGNDTVDVMGSESPLADGQLYFAGGDGDDRVGLLRNGTFDGGAGADTVGAQQGGTFNQT